MAFATIGAGNRIEPRHRARRVNNELTGDRLIKGIVTVEGVAARRRVLLLHRATGRLVGEAVSNEYGEYSFPFLGRGHHIVLAIDNERAFDAVVADMVMPVPPEGSE